MSDYSIAIKIAGQLEGSFTQALKGAQNGLSGLGIAGKIGGAAVKATAATITAAGTAIGAVGAYSANVGKEFESAMSSVAATADASAEDYAKLEAAAREMGRTTSKTAAESANALEYMALAGWDVDTSIKGLPSILRLSEASGMDLARTSDLVTDSMAALGVTVDNLPNYLDVAAKAQNKSNQSAEQLMEAYLNVGGTMKDLGVPIEESAAALGVLANRGRKGGEAGQALSAIMANLTTGTGQAGKMMQKLGISAFDSQGNFIGLQETIKKVNDATKNLSDEERNAALAALGGKQHVKDLNKLLAGLNDTNAEGVAEWDALTAQLKDCKGALDKMADTKMDNLEGDIAKLQSATQDFGISVYKHMQGPLRGLAQYGTEQMGILSKALEEGGFSGLAGALGGIFADGLTGIADQAPKFIEMAATLVDSLISGIENNEDAIGSAMGKLLVTGASAFIRLMPRIIVVGAKMAVAVAKGVRDNFPQLAAAAKEAVSYLMTEAKAAFGKYVDFLGDDSVKPFEKILALIPAVAAGFVGFKVIGGLVGKVSSFVGVLKGLGKAAPAVKNGMGTIGSSMSATAKNILGAGAGLAMAAAGVWLLADAAIRISEAGPGAAVGLALMAAGIGGFMVLAAKMGPELQASQQGLLAFGGAILMAAAGMSLMAFAAVQLAQAGPAALVGLALMEGGIIALLAIAGTMGQTLAAAAPGLLAFGGAILMVAAGFGIMAFAAVQLSQAGTTAIAVFAGMAVGLIAFMAAAALLGPMLTAAAPGLIAMGAGLLLCAAGMAILTASAIALANAGTPAIAVMAGLLVGVIAFGAAAGALAPLLLAGAAALAALGAAFAVVSAAAILGGAALAIITACLPQLSEYGASGAVAIAELGAALLVFAAGAAGAGIGAAAAAVGFAAFGVAAAAAAVGGVALAAALLAVSTETSSIATDASAAAASLREMVSSVSVVEQGLSALGNLIDGVGEALAGLFTSAPDFSGPAQQIAASIQIVATAGTALAVAMAAANAPMTSMLAAVTGIGTMGMMAATAMNSMAASSRMIGAAGASSEAGLTRLRSAMIATSATSGTAAAGLQRISTAFQTMNASVRTAASQYSSSINTMSSSSVRGVALITATVTGGMTAMVAVVRSGGAQIVAIATSTASGVQGAFNIDLSSSGRNMMQGLINGINSMRGQVEAAARSVAQAAAASVNSALQIHSPSRVLEQAGQYTGEGFAVGMQGSSGAVKAAAQSAMAQPAQDAGAEAAANRGSIIGDLVGSPGGNGGGANAGGGGQAEYNFTYSPSYTIQGNASKDDIVQADKDGQAEFERRMKEFLRKNGRIKFA